MTKITVTRALVSLKTLNAKIESAISSGKFVAKTIGKNQFKKVVGSNESVEAMTAKIQGSFDTVDSLIEQRAKIKSAIVMSNAATTVSVLGKEMPVAVAIELKSTLEFREKYLNTLRLQLARELNDIEKANALLDQAIEVSLNAIYGSEKSKVNEDSYKAVAGPQKEQKEAALLDPQKVEQKIAKLTQEILDLGAELDFTLSESNAMTFIEV